jgi:hypothetical protein
MIAPSEASVFEPGPSGLPKTAQFYTCLPARAVRQDFHLKCNDPICDPNLDGANCLEIAVKAASTLALAQVMRSPARLQKGNVC